MNDQSCFFFISGVRIIYMRASGMRLPITSDTVNISSMANLHISIRNFSNTSNSISALCPK